jgi:hypothetical protein
MKWYKPAGLLNYPSQETMAPKTKKDLSNYVEVKDRLKELAQEYPDYSIQTEVLARDERSVIIRAKVFKTRQDVLDGVFTSGIAHEVEGSNYINTTSFTENCETSAIGRALANMGFSVRADEPRPSREEMEKVQKTTEDFDEHLRIIGEFMAGDEDFDITISGKTVDLRAFIKKNSEKIKTQPSKAAEVAGFILDTLNGDDEDDDGVPTVNDD